MDGMWIEMWTHSPSDIVSFFGPRPHMVQSNRNKFDDLTKRIQAIYHTHSLTHMAFWIFFTHHSFRFSWTANLEISSGNAPLNYLLNRWWKFNANVLKNVWHEVYFVWLGFERVTSVGSKKFIPNWHTLTHTHSYARHPSHAHILRVNSIVHILLTVITRHIHRHYLYKTITFEQFSQK